MRISRLVIGVLLVALAVSACSPVTPEGQQTITLVADGSQQTLILSREATVAEVLSTARIQLDDDDRVNPPTFTRTEDGMIITVVRHAEELVVERVIIPFTQSTVRNEGLPYGETHLLQAGVNGEAEVTWRVVYQDGAEVSRTQVREVIINEAVEEVMMVGSAGDLPSVTINGTLAYISSGNAWVMEQSSANKRPLTVGGGLDGRVFSLSGDGRRLLFTRRPDWNRTPDLIATPTSDALAASTPTPAPTATPMPQTADEGDQPFNSLWAILDISDPASEAVELNIDNVLYAEWASIEERTIIYSTAEPRPSFPGWQANNDLWTARLSANGVAARREQVLAASSGGIYGWYGTTFRLGPDGSTLAWSQPDGVGILSELDEVIVPTPTGSGFTETPQYYARAELLNFPPANAYDFVWVPALSWSPDGAFIATTQHGEPLGQEQAEDSPVYDIVLVSADGSFAVTLMPQAGMWSMPQFSPPRLTVRGEEESWLAFLQAIEPHNSAVGRYRLAVADRDGSNQRLIYPPPDQIGLQPQIVAWSPEARQVALIDQGNLFIVDVITGLAQQLTGDGFSSNPRWTP